MILIARFRFTCHFAGEYPDVWFQIPLKRPRHLSLSVHALEPVAGRRTEECLTKLPVEGHRSRIPPNSYQMVCPTNSYSFKWFAKLGLLLDGLGAPLDNGGLDKIGASSFRALLCKGSSKDFASSAQSCLKGTDFPLIY